MNNASKPRRIAIVTGTRADYGLLRWLVAETDSDPSAELLLITTGTHNSSAFGKTVSEILADGYEPADHVDLLVDGDDKPAVAKSTGLGVLGFTESFGRHQPDIVVLLGDRYEILAAATAAFLLGIPIAHIHGGEVTTGAQDDGIRHAVSKLASLHFVAAEPYRRRLVQLGEPPERIYVVGAPGLENFRRLTLEDRSAFERRIGSALGRPTFLLTYHPVTAAAEDAVEGLETVCRILASYGDALILCTGSNADAGGRAINQRMEQLSQELGNKIRFDLSLGQLGYLSALIHADAVIGNSSSGVIEAPAAGTPTVNIGRRQEGRLHGPSVIDCAPSEAAIREAVERALSPEMQSLAAKKENPYAEHGYDIARSMLDVLLSTDLKALAGKPFHDLDASKF